MAKLRVEELAVEPRAPSAPTDPRKAPFGNPIALPWDGEPYPQDGIPYPDPDLFRITSLNPATAVLGGANFTLHVLGLGFVSGMVIYWNGSPEPTTFVSATELTTGVNMATATVAITIPVAVRTVDGSESNIRSFTLTAP